MNPSPELPDSNKGSEPSWLRRIADSANLMAAWERVRRNRGAPGTDGESVAQFERRLPTGLPRIRQSLLEGSYLPHPVRAVDIPKPSCGVRTLGIPTVEDRVVQEAIAQVLTPVWERLFSPSSHGYRRGHDAQDAVSQVQQHLVAGREWLVDLDIERFFDRIHHDRLLEALKAHVQDDALLRLIRDFLEAGMVRGGYRLPSTEGTPQGSPLSPLLANIVLDAFDQHLDHQEQAFSRYADDVVLLCATEEEARSALDDARCFLRERLNLALNESKTRLCTPPEVTFLGFSFQRDPAGAWRRCISAASLESFRAQVDQMTCEETAVPGEGDLLLRELAAYVHGWENYYRHPETSTTVKRLRAHARTALRRLFWCRWGSPERRVAELVRRGIPVDAARHLVQTCPDAATAAVHPVMGNALPNAYFASFGLGPETSPGSLPYGVVTPHSVKRASPGAPAGRRSSAVGGDNPDGPKPGGIGLHLGWWLSLGRFGALRGTFEACAVPPSSPSKTVAGKSK
ncbi:MAG: group II intron reverse transcriptase/maturase [Verrucomicrobiales bacterium]|nr:group II intron reverse transcriptase/maturase [Verrucomicrobiae bacterium]